MGSSSGSYLKHIKDVYTSYYGKEISLLTNYVTVQFLYTQIRITFLAIAIKIKVESFQHFEILEMAGVSS